MYLITQMQMLHDRVDAVNWKEHLKKYAEYNDLNWNL